MAVHEIPEKSTSVYSATFKDETGAVVGGGVNGMSSITATLYSLDSPTLVVITGGLHSLTSDVPKDVFGVNNGTYDTNTGVFELTLQAADNQVLNPALSRERHRLLIEYAWNSSAKTANHVVDIVIINRNKVT